MRARTFLFSVSPRPVVVFVLCYFPLICFMAFFVVFFKKTFLSVSILGLVLVFVFWRKGVFFHGLLFFSGQNWRVVGERGIHTVSFLNYSLVTRFIIILYGIDEEGVKYRMLFHALRHSSDFRYLYALLKLSALS